jgi:Ca-activated chloride channel homolog
MREHFLLRRIYPVITLNEIHNRSDVGAITGLPGVSCEACTVYSFIQQGGSKMNKRKLTAILCALISISLVLGSCGTVLTTGAARIRTTVPAGTAGVTAGGTAGTVASDKPGDTADAAASTSNASGKQNSSSGRLLASAEMAKMAPRTNSIGGQAAIMPVPQPAADSDMNTEDYDAIVERNFVSPFSEPLSTFSADVDTASWSNIRRFINMGMVIPADAVRIEEMINYFPYGYAEPTDDVPFAVHPELGACAWNTKHLLMRIGIQGKRIDKSALPDSNLVFLLDVSGSMDDPLKLPLVKSAFQLLVEQLKDTDRISIVTYAGSESVVLNGATGDKKAEIQAAINDLSAGGSTAGAQGLVTAYELASGNFISGGNNRVILATDGDFNVGVSSDGEMVRLIEKQRGKGVFLSVLGFGTGNVKDNKMEKLADNGNGNYAYIDSIKEAQKVLVNEMGGTLFTIAKDVKFQVEFNPAMVKGYRLIGYENRMLAAEDFNNDQKDAGDIGAGHSVTALYEIIPATSEEVIPGVDTLKYQDKPAVSGTAEWMTIKIRYKDPDAETSKLLSFPIAEDAVSAAPSEDFTFQSAVAEAGMVLRDSAFKSNATMEHAVSLASSVLSTDNGGYRQEFADLMRKAGQADTGRESD